MSVYKKIKKQNGERFAQTLRAHHNGIFEIPNLAFILKHAGNDAHPLLPYLMNLLTVNTDKSENDTPTENPFTLLSQAGYHAFYANNETKKNSIKPYFEEHEQLCTFTDETRHQDYHIVHAIKENADDIKRQDFKGREQRQDAYGTSVISIQMLKSGGFISIKNRYNHTIENCDHTFDSNPDNIIGGLSRSLQDHFNVDFSTQTAPLPARFVRLSNGQILHHYGENNNIYYGDHVWAKDGKLHHVDKTKGDAMFNGFIFDNKTKKLVAIDPRVTDHFDEDFNRYYGGNPDLQVVKGNLTLNGDILIEAKNSQITKLYLPDLEVMTPRCLETAKHLEEAVFPNLTMMEKSCLFHVQNLKKFIAPKLISIDGSCLLMAQSLIEFHAPLLRTIGPSSLVNVDNLTCLHLPNLERLEERALYSPSSLKKFHAPNLSFMANFCFSNAKEMTHFYAPHLEYLGSHSFFHSGKLTSLTVTPNAQMPDYLKKIAAQKSTQQKKIAPI